MGGVLWQVRRATKRNKCNQRHNSLKRQRTEAPWNFTKNPLGVTKVLTIPWEFKQNQKENIPRLKIDCKSSSRTTAHLSHCFQINCCIKWGSSTCVKAFYCTCISLVGRRCTLLNYFHKEPLDGGQLGPASLPFLLPSASQSRPLWNWGPDRIRSLIDTPVLHYVRTDFNLKVKGEGRRKKGGKGKEKGKRREKEGVIVTKVYCERFTWPISQLTIRGIQLPRHKLLFSFENNLG